MKKEKRIVLMCIIGFFVLFSFTYSINIVSSAGLDDYLVAYWPFEGNANDASGHGFDGEVQGNMRRPNDYGRKGRSYNFDGTNDYILLKKNPTENITQDFSWTGWAKLINRIEDSVLYNRGDQEWGYQLYFTNGKIGVAYRRRVGGTSFDVIYCQTSQQVNDGKWHFIVATFKRDGANIEMKLYLDNTLVPCTTPTTIRVAAYAQKSARIGGVLYVPVYKSGYWKSRIDEIRIYNKTLTQEELIEARAAGIDRGLIAYWPFNTDDGSNETFASDIIGTYNGIINPQIPNKNISDPIYSPNTGLGLFNYSQVYYFNPNRDSINILVGEPEAFTKSLTWSGWIKTPAPENKLYTIYERGGNAYGYVIFLRTSKQLTVGYRSSNNDRDYTPCVSNLVLNDLTWYFINVVLNSSTNKALIYINGNLDKSCNIDFVSNTHSPEEGSIGNVYGTHVNPNMGDNYYPYSGLIDEVKISDIALSVENIYEDYMNYFCDAAWECGKNIFDWNCWNCSIGYSCSDNSDYTGEHVCIFNGGIIKAYFSYEGKEEIPAVYNGTKINMTIEGTELINSANISYTLYNFSNNAFLFSFNKTALNESLEAYAYTFPGNFFGEVYFNATLIPNPSTPPSPGAVLEKNSEPLKIVARYNYTPCLGSLPGNASWNDGANPGIFRQRRLNETGAEDPAGEFENSKYAIYNETFEQYSCHFKCYVGYFWNGSDCLRMVAGPQFCWNIGDEGNCSKAANKLIAKNSLGSAGNNCENFVNNSEDDCSYSVSCSCYWNSTGCNPMQNFTLAEDPNDLDGDCSPTNQEMAQGDLLGECEFISIGVEDNCNNTLSTLKFMQKALWTPADSNSIESCRDQTTIYPCASTAKLPFFGSFNFVISIFVLIFIYLVYYNIKRKR